MSALEDCYGYERYANAPAAPRGFFESGGEGAYLAHENVFRQKYRYWRGCSGRSYVFSVYGAQDCPAYEDAVLIVVRRGEGVWPLALVETGAFPDRALALLRERFRQQLADLEFQVHVLTDGRFDGCTLIEDVTRAFRDA